MNIFQPLHNLPQEYRIFDYKLLPYKFWRHFSFLASIFTDKNVVDLIIILLQLILFPLEVFRMHSVSVWWNFHLQFLSYVLFCFKYLSLFFSCDLMCVSFILDNVCILYLASLVAQRVKHLPALQETWVWSLGREDPLEKEMATHSSILAWKIPWTEEPDRL